MGAMAHSNTSNASGILARSDAFRDAALRSEIRRSYAMIAVVFIVALPMIFVTRAQSNNLYNLWLVASAAAIALLGMQVFNISLIRWLRRHDRGLPIWFGVATVIIESGIPTGVMLTHIRIGTLAPYAAITSPAIVVYSILITLTTLRLQPLLCLLAGAVSAGGFAALLLYIIFGLGIRYPTTGLHPEAYIMIFILILTSGVAAAWVTREIRTHLNAALGEAETRRQMDRINQDLEVARSIQQALLPREVPRLAGYDIAGWNRPADQTGGDYYDWQMAPDGNWIITLADVCGHGIGPALVTAACRAYVRASSSHHRDLESLAVRINRLLAEDLPAGRFVTMACVLIDPKGGPVALLSAGHGPIVLCVSATGQTHDIMPSDLPLAIDADSTFGPAQLIDLQPGDVLALVTDGFVEWSKPGETQRRHEFGIERLRESLKRHAHLPASEIIAGIARDVEAFAGDEPQQDDLTMVVIRRDVATCPPPHLPAPPSQLEVF